MKHKINKDLYNHMVKIYEENKSNPDIFLNSVFDAIVHYMFFLNTDVIQKLPKLPPHLVLLVEKYLLMATVRTGTFIGACETLLEAEIKENGQES